MSEAQLNALLAARRSALDQAKQEGRGGFLRYRREQEATESGIERRNREVYVCPFYGPLLRRPGRLGCMIHPLETGDPQAQDVGFYGASICLSYDCRNKERDETGVYARLAAAAAEDDLQYSRLMGDVRWFEFWRRHADLDAVERNVAAQAAYLRLCRRRLDVLQPQISSSFESPWSDSEDCVAALCALLDADRPLAAVWDEDLRKCLEVKAA
ncbi:MAG: hypothetical protein K1X75_03345 [Leptospirales bacterium]|nr:hypothetical protein [Leptospirales bacterium]